MAITNRILIILSSKNSKCEDLKKYPLNQLIGWQSKFGCSRKPKNTSQLSILLFLSEQFEANHQVLISRICKSAECHMHVSALY